MDNSIYIAVGFKSYDIARTSGMAETQYEWTEKAATSSEEQRLART